MQFQLDHCLLRPLETSDARALARWGSNWAVWSNLRSRFPHPATEQDMVRYIDAALQAAPETTFAIEIDRLTVGVISVVQGQADWRRSAELSYWLAEEHWRKGIVSAAVPVVVDYAAKLHDLARVESFVFSSNIASARVLEKAGFEQEGLLRKSVVKEGKLIDRWVYAFYPSESDVVR